MQILVVAATEMEIAALQARLPNLDVLITGVGAPQTIHQLSKRFSQSDYQAVIQAGIAGCFSQNLSLGEVVAVQRDRFADLGILEAGRLNDLTESGLAFNKETATSSGWISNESFLMNKVLLKKASAVTVNLAGDTPGFTKLISEKYQPDIESMEGAAFHFICKEYKQPFLQLRGISNRVGERDKQKWNIQGAVMNLNKELLKLIGKLNDGAIENETYNDHE